MANTNFLQFDTQAENMLDDESYAGDSQRVSGVATGLARSALYNKQAFQASTMATALAMVMVQNGQNAMDNNLNSLAANLQNTFITSGVNNTFSGVNTFTNITKFKANTQEVLDAILGTPPSETKYAVYGFEDKNGTWLGGFEQVYSTNGYILKQMVQFKPDGSNNTARFQVGYDNNQSEYVGASSGVMQGINRWGMPNYNAGYTFPYGGVTPYNGVIKVRHLEYVNAQLYVGSNLVYNHTWGGGDFGSQYQETFIPVSNGETITWANMESVIFIPCNGG